MEAICAVQNRKTAADTLAMERLLSLSGPHQNQPSQDVLPKYGVRTFYQSEAFVRTCIRAQATREMMATGTPRTVRMTLYVLGCCWTPATVCDAALGVEKCM